MLMADKRHGRGSVAIGVSRNGKHSPAALFGLMLMTAGDGRAGLSSL
jgi:hypothetical protein